MQSCSGSANPGRKRYAALAVCLALAAVPAPAAFAAEGADGTLQNGDSTPPPTIP